MKLREDNPALSEHRTVFPYRVKTVTEVKHVLQSVATLIRRGKLTQQQGVLTWTSRSN